VVILMGMGKINLSKSTFFILFLAVGFIVGMSFSSVYAGIPWGTSEIADNAITSEKIKNRQVKTGDIKNKAIKSIKIRDGTIQFKDINQNSCALNQIMKWDGSQWVCATDNDTTEPGSIKHVQLNDDVVGNAAGWNPNGVISIFSITDPDISANSRVIATIGGGSASTHIPADIFCDRLWTQENKLRLNCFGGVNAAPDGSILRYTIFNPPTIIIFPP